VLKTDSVRSRRVGIALVSAGHACVLRMLDATAKWLVQDPAGGAGGVAALCHPCGVDAVLMALLLAPRHGLAIWCACTTWRLHLLRSAMLASMTALNFWALQYLQLAETGAMQFSVPILIALLSAWWLGERLDAAALGWPSWGDSRACCW
jgi:drug/metabolite transporter (DMT)-like permease